AKDDRTGGLAQSPIGIDAETMEQSSTTRARDDDPVAWERQRRQRVQIDTACPERSERFARVAMCRQIGCAVLHPSLEFVGRIGTRRRVICDMHDRLRPKACLGKPSDGVGGSRSWAMN